MHDVRELMGQLSDKYAVVRGMAVQALGELGDRLAVPALFEVLSEDEDDFVRTNARKALAKLGEEIPALIESLSDDSLLNRREAVEELGLLGNRSAIPSLIKALDDPSRVVRTQVAQSLGALGDSRAVVPLIEAFRSGCMERDRRDDMPGEFLLSVVTALGHLCDPRAIGPLTEMLNTVEAWSTLHDSLESAMEQIMHHSAVTQVQPADRPERVSPGEAETVPFAGSSQSITIGTLIQGPVDQSQTTVEGDALGAGAVKQGEGVVIKSLSIRVDRRVESHRTANLSGSALIVKRGSICRKPQLSAPAAESGL